ncbi:IclR family transcriptional regulator [Amycolatopsis magusensis]|uniref:DNA-binding IclR family transcriptional regulator n=1 Tax=Amycolatopsis magusensis TaxID=882444 RepID=A0ABS4PGN9_9PSEU|nr:helix-turn-helix domain-containing protein [Amycolatopsis magusensis]MBP2178574.1 DNA-binding IclR family transcriptional regulator [Amycolatopsis magusensis]MDI5979358.1 helix-turn-helix domain-containing protein [Amycolatopsis magusensis]
MTAKRTPGASSSRKVLQLLLAFSERRPEATVAELAALLGTPIATTYRYVALLKELQLLEEGRAGRYHPTSQVMPLARAAQVANDLARLARPVMEDVARELRETVLLFQHFGDSAVCAERVECDQAVRFTFQPGHSVPLGAGASGRMLLASLPEPERSRRLAEVVQRSGGSLREELKRVEVNRYAVEVDEGAWSCSVPVRVPGQRATVLTVAGPAMRIGDAAKRAAIAVLHSHAQRIQEAFTHFVL